MIHSSTKLQTLTAQAEALMNEQSQIIETTKSSSTAPHKIQALEQRYLVITDQLQSLAEQYDKEMLDIAAKTNETVFGLLERKENLEVRKDALEKSFDYLVSTIDTPDKFGRATKVSASFEMWEIKETLAAIDKELGSIRAQLRAAIEGESGNESLTATSIDGASSKQLGKDGLIN